MTDLAQRVEDANVNSEMFVSVSQQLADSLRVFVTGAVSMVTLNAVVGFKDVVDCLNVGILKIMDGSNVMGTVIDENDSREF